MPAAAQPDEHLPSGPVPRVMKNVRNGRISLKQSKVIAGGQWLKPVVIASTHRRYRLYITQLKASIDYRSNQRSYCSQRVFWLFRRSFLVI